MSWPRGGIFGDVWFRRGFVDTSYGQVHYRYRKGDGRPLVLLHASPGSAASLLPLMARLNPSRPLYAFDTLGNGDSAPPPDDMREIANFTKVTRETIETLGLGVVDLYGTHTGAHLALQLCLDHPESVRRVILDGMGLYSRTDSSSFEDEYCPVVEKTDHGSQLGWVWNFVKMSYISFPWFSRSAGARTDASVPPADFLHMKTVEVLKALDTYRLSYLAAFKYPKRERLAELRTPCLVTVGRQDVLAPYFDDFKAAVPQAAEARFIEAGNLEEHFSLLAASVDEFLDCDLAGDQ